MLRPLPLGRPFPDLEAAFSRLRRSESPATELSVRRMRLLNFKVKRAVIDRQSGELLPTEKPDNCRSGLRLNHRKCRPSAGLSPHGQPLGASGP
jgi:hypothetical protein